MATCTFLVWCKITWSISRPHFLAEILGYIFVSWFGVFHDENKDGVEYEFKFFIILYLYYDIKPIWELFMIIGASSHLDVKQNMCFSFQTILHLYMTPLCLNLQVEQLIQYKNLNITLMIVIRVIVLDDLVDVVINVTNMYRACI